MKFKVLFIFLFLLFSVTTVAQLPPDIELEGDEITYSKNKQQIYVSGNVVLEYQNYSIKAERFILDIENEFVHFPSLFTFYQGYEEFNGKNLYYDFKNRTGYANYLEAQVENLYFSGEKLLIFPDKFELRNVTCSTCTDKNGYIIKSDSLSMYYLLGVLIARKSVISVSFLPFDIPVPYFLYGSSRIGVLKNSNILPDIGSSKLEGNYAKQTIAYVINPKVSGSVQLYGSEKLGFAYGGSNLVYLKDNFSFFSDYLHFFDDRSVRGQVGFSYDFLKRNATSLGDDLFQGLTTPFFSKKDKQINMSIFFQNKVIVNDVFVSYSPFIDYTVQNVSFLNHYNHNFTLNYGWISEYLDDDIKYDNHRVNYLQESRYVKPITSKTSFLMNTFLNIIFYDDSHWNRLFHSVGFSFENVFKYKVMYNKKLYNEGASPFLFERNYAVETDELEFDWEYSIGQFKFQNLNFYSLELHEFRDSQMSLEYTFNNCWMIGLGWRSLKEQFFFIFSIK
ncbi:hypothetical protein DID76_02860 [Candidatus Marinamargulisbacteria bacterium SCGC AG-414-C22]|nr:hypothetical protein DID76_02860 [Candidatus Marinamargulisbacteria bacterium SCGC AG-414-C22]